MARGAEGKLRRRNRKKEEKANAGRIFGGVDEEEENGNADFSQVPLPPGMGGKDFGDDEDGDDNDDGDEKEEMHALKEKKKKSKKISSSDNGELPQAPKKKSQGIKQTPLILLILMTGTTLLPALIYASDYLGNFFQKHHVIGQLGFRLGMGAVPRKRVLSFYEKHDPAKIDQVPDILSKYYGDYPTLTKKLERKYQDYGYFLGWEEDEAALTLAVEKMRETYAAWIHSYWNVYAPQPLKTAARNIRYNLTFLQKKLRKVWKRYLWPTLEPFFGVPKGGEKQKRADAAEARKRKKQSAGASGTRRRSSEFRDDVDDEQ